MREFLFRCQGVNKKNWIYGLVTLINEKDSYCLIRPKDSNISYECMLNSLCQYTDSIAAGGKKIFEHDIVEVDGAIGIVKFGKYGNGFHLGYYIDWINCPHLRNELNYWVGCIKVIGNIFDNPELLKGE